MVMSKKTTGLLMLDEVGFLRRGAGGAVVSACRLYSCTGLGRGTPCRFEAWTLDLEIEVPGQPLIQTEVPGWFRVQLSEYYNFGQIDPLDAALFLVKKMAF